MIKINKESWHYKLVKFGQTNEHEISNNLCTYFWQSVKGVLLGMFGIVIVTLIGSTFLYMLAAPFMSLLLPESIFAFILCIFYGVIIMKVAIESISEDHWLAIDVFAKFKSKEKERKPSIIKEYLKAKKQKICPTLTFE